MCCVSFYCTSELEVWLLSEFFFRFKGARRCFELFRGVLLFRRSERTIGSTGGVCEINHGASAIQSCPLQRSKQEIRRRRAYGKHWLIISCIIRRRRRCAPSGECKPEPSHRGLGYNKWSTEFGWFISFCTPLVRVKLQLTDWSATPPE